MKKLLITGGAGFIGSAVIRHIINNTTHSIVNVDKLTYAGNLIVAVDKRYFRPTEVETLLGDPTKAKEKLGWEPKITLEEMVHEMMENDINIAKRDSLVKEHGFKAPDFNE